MIYIQIRICLLPVPMPLSLYSMINLFLHLGHLFFSSTQCREPLKKKNGLINLSLGRPFRRGSVVENSGHRSPLMELMLVGGRMGEGDTAVRCKAVWLWLPLSPRVDPARPLNRTHPSHRREGCRSVSKREGSF